MIMCFSPTPGANGQRHMKPADKNTVDQVVPDSDGVVTYIIHNDKAHISTWGRFPKMEFWLPDFGNFLFCEDGYDDLKKLLVVFIEKNKKDARALAEAASEEARASQKSSV